MNGEIEQKEAVERKKDTIVEKRSWPGKRDDGRRLLYGLRLADKV